jgi:hypothetical protein
MHYMIHLWNMLPISTHRVYRRIYCFSSWIFIHSTVDIAEHLLMEYIVKSLRIEDIHGNKCTNGYIAEYPFTGYIVRNGAAT